MCLSAIKIANERTDGAISLKLDSNDVPNLFLDESNLEMLRRSKVQNRESHHFGNSAGNVDAHFGVRVCSGFECEISIREAVCAS